jgi:hypothetical protein
MTSSSSSLLWEVNEDELLFCLIDNTKLHCLGGTLLQIDRLEKSEPRDVLGVRKVAKVSSTLEPCYQEITQKCLLCDFGYGADIGIVGALKLMVSTLSMGDKL